ncbi:ABC transporter ATP-binding protein [Listeria kieliensis]|uniref:Bacitracin ABC transporter ATP-binding protein n=1 Tax=Listeria kieliensis TaxID=1621700 RepID=A0A3D8TT35_9LIST|nr:ATP-binding cassette domain-containing protein [Listeria kieliensis]RDX00966.1 bacitracin ABC transporter ATP-binding protein [Listeria kieliensis]
MTEAIKLRGINKSFKKQAVLQDISMTIKKGSIYGFLGPNGSGKTTVMKIILNLVKADSGEVSVLGEAVETNSYQYLQSIGSIIEYPVFYDTLTAEQNLELHCNYMGVYDKAKIQKVLELVDLKGITNKKVKEFSLGMKQRLGIARALITEPKILVLDEPINGLDPFGIREVRELLVKINREMGTTILISSHIISEIESIADTIGFIKNGKIVREVELKEIEKETLSYSEITVNDVKKASSVLDEHLKIRNFKIISENAIRIYEAGTSQQEISRHLILEGVEIYEMQQHTDSLEEYFVELMNDGEKK